VGCAVNVDVRHGDILRTMSVEDDPRSDGWLCDRGRYNVGFYRDGARISAPMYRDGDSFIQIGWDDAITLWAKAIRDAIAAKGPTAVGAIGGGRLLNEEAYLLQYVFRALGVQNLDWRAGRQETATPPGDGTFADLERAQTIVIVGRPPSQTAPVLDLRIRKAVKHHGARLFTLGPLPSGSFVNETRLDRIDDLPPDALAAERIAVVYDGIESALFSSVTAALSGKTLSTYLAGEQPNARGAEAMGVLPRDGGLNTRDMLTAAAGGSLDVLALFGVNPVLQFADGELARAALAAVPFSVVTELFMTQTAQLATLVLPALGAFEKQGHALDLTGGVAQVTQAFEPLPGALSDADILVALAAELGVAIPAPAELEAAARQPSRPPAASARAAASVSGNGKAAELTVVFAADIFAGGGTVYHDDRLGALRPRAQATLGPRTGQALDVRDGDMVDVLVDGRPGLESLTVCVDDAAREGTLVLIDGLPLAPANAIAPGAAVTLGNIRSLAAEATA
jgi:NADH-quinone oxidoreductase subunit G